MQKMVYEPVCLGKSDVSCTRQDDKLVVELQKGANLDFGVSLIEVSRKADETISICIDIRLERGTTFQLLSTKIALESKAWSLPKTVSIKRLTETGPRFYSPEDIITGSVGVTQDASKPLNTRGITLWLESAKGTLCETNIPAVTEFTLHMPDVAANGQKMHIPPMHFVAKKKWVIEGLCC